MKGWISYVEDHDRHYRGIEAQLFDSPGWWDVFDSAEPMVDLGTLLYWPGPVLARGSDVIAAVALLEEAPAGEVELDVRLPTFGVMGTLALGEALELVPVARTLALLHLVETVKAMDLKVQRQETNLPFLDPIARIIYGPLLRKWFAKSIGEILAVDSQIVTRCGPGTGTADRGCGPC